MGTGDEGIVVLEEGMEESLEDLSTCCKTGATRAITK